MSTKSSLSFYESRLSPFKSPALNHLHGSLICAFGLFAITALIIFSHQSHANDHWIDGHHSGNLNKWRLDVHITPDSKIPEGAVLKPFVVAHYKDKWYYLPRKLKKTGVWVIGKDPHLSRHAIVKLQSRNFVLHKRNGKPVPKVIEVIRDHDMSRMVGARIYAGYIGTTKPLNSRTNRKIAEGVQASTPPVYFQSSLVANVIAPPANWPEDHIAMGTAIANGDTTGDNSIYPNAQLEAVNLYGTANGTMASLTFQPTKTIGGMISLAENMGKLQKNGRNVVPVLVAYTNSASVDEKSGTLPDPTGSGGGMGQAFLTPNMTGFFKLLINDCEALDSDLSTQAPSIIVNPDFLGTLESNLIPTPSRWKSSDTIAPPEFTAPGVADATNYLMSGSSNEPCQNGSVPAAGVTNNICVTDALFAADPTAQTLLENERIQFSNDLAGYIQAVNWLIRHHAPKGTTIGWQSNIFATYCTSQWRCSTDKLWPHYATSSSDIANLASQIADFWINLGMYSGNNAPDFIAFDKWAINGLNAYGHTRDSGYTFNQRDMANYIMFVKQVSAKLNTPAMLWQIPGGHFNTAGSNLASMSTEAQYIFGDSNADPNANQNLVNTKIPTSLYGLPPDQYSLATYLGTGWDQDHLVDVYSANIFAVLWGSGSCATSMGLYPSSGACGIQTDTITVNGVVTGWLQDKANTYYDSLQ